MAETREDARKAFDLFVSSYSVKNPKAVKFLEKDRDELLGFYDFPAEHWRLVRTTNPIESIFEGRAPSASSHVGLREQECLPRKGLQALRSRGQELAQARRLKAHPRPYSRHPIQGWDQGRGRRVIKSPSTTLDHISQQCQPEPSYR